jgi:hypothetical protein
VQYAHLAIGLSPIGYRDLAIALSFGLSADRAIGLFDLEIGPSVIGLSLIGLSLIGLPVIGLPGDRVTG